jgi:hypothetical protein
LNEIAGVTIHSRAEIRGARLNADGFEQEAVAPENEHFPEREPLHNPNDNPAYSVAHFTTSRQLQTASQINEWLSSPALQPPK